MGFQTCTKWDNSNELIENGRTIIQVSSALTCGCIIKDYSQTLFEMWLVKLLFILFISY